MLLQAELPLVHTILAMFLLTLVVVGHTTTDPGFICEECVVVKADADLGATDQDLVGSYRYHCKLLQLMFIWVGSR